MTAPNGTPSRTPTLTDVAYDAIKHRILAVHLPPGAHFTEAQLSAELSLGKTPVREALARLQREDLVEVVPRSGYRVAPLTLKDIRDLFALRVLLEGEAVRLASLRPLGQEQLRRLEELCYISYVVEDRERFSRAISDNTAFHVGLAEASDNRRLVRLVRDMMEQMERVLHITIAAMSVTEINQREHLDLLQAVVDGHGDRARALVEEQCREWQDRMVGVLISTDAVLNANLGGMPPSGLRCSLTDSGRTAS